MNEADNDIEIQIADNGIRRPEAVLHAEGNSLGMELMKGLTDDIKGTILFDISAGTRIIIGFKRPMIREHR